ncbi:MAG TPA: cobalamin-binding protein [Pyrinomonadaceae bacterium]
MTDHKGKQIALAVFLTASLVTALGCSKTTNLAAPNTNYRSVQDDLGREVRLPQKVQRAISLAPNITEMVFAVGAGDRLVGDTTYCNYPEAAKSIQKVGDTLTPNMETIVALKPDIVLVSTASQLETFTHTLEQNSIAVYISNPHSIDEVFKSMRELGEIFGTRDQVESSISKLRERVQRVSRDRRPSDRPPKVFLQISEEPLFTIGRDSFLTEIIKNAGGESVTKDVPGGYPKLSKETALVLNPDVIILSDSSDNRAPGDAFKSSPAVKNGRILRVNADVLSRPGPRSVDALEQVSAFLRPRETNKTVSVPE